MATTGTKVTAQEQQVGTSDQAQSQTVFGKGNVVQSTESLGVSLGSRASFSGTLLQPGANQSNLVLGENAVLSMSSDEQVIDTTLSRTAEILAGFSNRTADSEAALAEAYGGTQKTLSDALSLKETGGLSLIKPLAILAAILAAFWIVAKLLKP